MNTCFVLAAAVSAVMLTPVSAMAAPAEPEPFKSAIPGNVGLKCTTTAGYEGDVRFCPGNGGSERVPSWDGVPLDVDVTLPPQSDGDGPFPTIVMLHGYGGSKTDFESKKAEGEGSGASAAEIFDYNNDYYAQHGYAVINYTARGFGNSCGGQGGLPSTATASNATCLAHGFIHLADQRYEARDTQYLLGLLVDEGISNPQQLGVTGISYGGGQSTELAYLRDRIRCAGPEDPYTGIGKDPCSGQSENALVPWVSPNGSSLSIAAAYARWPWSDLASALVPNGRFLDYDDATDGQDGSSTSESPIGVPIQSYITGLYADGAATGYYEPATGSPEWNLTKDFVLIAGGEPESAEDQQVIDNIAAYHGGYGLSGKPAALLMQSGWNDDLFPPAQALRVYDSVRQREPAADIALQFGDVGHSRGSNKPRVNEYFNDQGAAFFAKQLKGMDETVSSAAGTAQAPAAGSVTTFTTTCPSGASGAPDGGPYTASSWQDLHQGVVSFSSSTEQTITNPGGSSQLGLTFDPILQQEDPSSAGACTTASATQSLGTASYSTVSRGFTLMGLPTVVAKLAVSGTVADDGQLDARLWDVQPDGQELLVSRGGYRLSEPSPEQVVFQLHGNGYRFPAGDTVKLELTSNDAPYYRPSNGPFAISVKSAQVVLPTDEKPNGEQIEPPESVSLPLPETQPQTPTNSSPTPAGTSATATVNIPIARIGIEASHSSKVACSSRRGIRIHLPRYRHGRVTQIVVLIDGKRAKKLTGTSLHSVLISLKGRPAGRDAVTLEVRVVSGGHGSVHLIRRHYRLCA